MKLALTVLLCVSWSGIAVSEERLDPALPYQAERRHPVRYDVEFAFVVTAPYKTKQLRVWVPLPPSDVAQEVTGRELSAFPDDVRPEIATETVYGNQFACFTFEKPQGAQIVRHRFQVKVWELNWKIAPAGIETVRNWPASFAPYRRSDGGAVVVDQRFENLLAEIVPERATAAGDFQRVLKWVDRNFEYDHVNASLQARSEHGLERRRGHCSDYHGFCAAMGRALGVPTRVTYGINPFPKASPSHCKLEAYLAPYGWVSFDVSETQKLAELIRKTPELTDDQRLGAIARAQGRLMSGFRDNTWFLQTRGSRYELAPRASSGPVNVVRTIYAEADGVPLVEPDPSNKDQTAFTWMTAHRYRADRDVPYPFADVRSLEE